MRVAIGLLTLGLLVYLFDPLEIAGDLAAADLRFVAAGFGTCAIILVVRSIKWMFILRRMGIHASLPRLLEVYTISYWFSTFLPGSMGGDLYRVYDVARAADRKIRPALSVVIDRLSGVLALLLLTSTALIFHGSALPLPGWLLPAVIGITTAGALSLLALLLYVERLHGLVNTMAPWTRRILKPEKMERFHAVSRELRGNPRLFAEALGLGLIIQALVLLAYFLMARAISDRITITFFYTLYPLVEIASMAPVSINGMGVREGLTVASMQYYHITPAMSLSMGILFRLVAMAMALAGGVLLLIRRSGHWKTGHPDGTPPSPD